MAQIHFFTSPELEVVETHEVGLSMAHLRYNRYSEKAAHGKRAESKQHVMQCVRESHREPDEEQSTNSCPEATMSFQF